jgi:peptidoglycan/LPS O-acetylase OafA/YrhL
VEEHFYLLWPVAVRNLSSRAILGVCAAIVLLSPLLRWVSFQLAAAKGWVSYETFDYTWNSADGLACGAFLAAWLREFAPDRKKFGKEIAVLLAIGFALLPFGILSRHTAAGAALQVVPWHFLFVVVIGAALLAGSRWGEAVRCRLLEFFGEISYGLYLYHLLVFGGFQWLLEKGIIRRLQIDPMLGLSIRLLICGGIAVGIAYLSRRYIEEPFLRLKSRLAP